jgi:catechol 2,3-dioxygenase-like lactoylglutathione lyase family enzyme
MIKVSGLATVILYVSEMERAVAFYRDCLGMKVIYPVGLATYKDESWVELDAISCKLALHEGGRVADDKADVNLVFEVADLQAARKSLLEANFRADEIRSVVPNVSFFQSRDPDGNIFCLQSR